VSFGSTPSQTVGPYFAIGLPWDEGHNAVPEGTPGAIQIRGTVLDGHGSIVPDAMIEVWGADPDGRYADLHGFGGPSALEGFRGFARTATGDEGIYVLRTIKPGPVPGLDERPQAPHLAVSVFARGMLHRLVTRIYFADEETANAADPLLVRVPAERRATLIAQPTDDGYRFDIRIQGPGETVFLDV
jgi:protocatechuate 3,4-dioxygenase alpha subunit